VSRAIDEWIYWFKNEQVREDSKSKNIKKVREKLAILKMSQEERVEYEKYLEKLASERDILRTAYDDGRKKTIKELMPIIEQERKEKAEAKRKEAEAKRKAEQERKEKEQARRKAEQERKEKEQIKERLKATAKIMKNQGIALDVIKEATGLSDKEIEKL
jgi:colicin import membrane protein